MLLHSFFLSSKASLYPGDIIVNLTGSTKDESNVIYPAGKYKIEIAPGLSSPEIERVGQSSMTLSAKTCIMEYTENIPAPFFIRAYCGSNATNANTPGTNPYSGDFKVNAVNATTLSSSQPVGVDVTHIFGAGGGNSRGTSGSGILLDYYYYGGGANCLGNGNTDSQYGGLSSGTLSASGAGSCLHLLPLNGVFGTNYLRAYHIAPKPSQIYCGGGSAYGGGATSKKRTNSIELTRGGNSNYGNGATTANTDGSGIGHGRTNGEAAGAYFNGTTWVDVAPNVACLTAGVLAPSSYIKVTYLGPS